MRIEMTTPEILNGATLLSIFLLAVAVVGATCVVGYLATVVLTSKLTSGAVEVDTVLCTVDGSARTWIPGVRRARVTYSRGGEPFTALSGPILTENLPRVGSELLGTLYAVKHGKKPTTYWIDVPHG